MKLQRLVITAFGPYAERQELDFEYNLKDKNMFVITGNTGAGKTTIFDAINFALYGEASGSDRDGKSLRSDFADPMTETEVELYFSLRGRDYYIKRSPSYLRLSKRGDKMVESKASAEMRLSKDKTLTGATDVTREVERILGITSEQFKQLVMIPQGEFKRLLLAKNEEKEDIFRKIFGTEVFESIQKQIKKQALTLENNIKQTARDRQNKIKSFDCKDKDEELFRLIYADKPNIDLLMNKFAEFIETDVAYQKAIEEDFKKVEERITGLTKERDLGDEVNKKFDKADKNKKEFEELNTLQGEFDIKRKLLQRGKKALNVKVYEDKYKDKKNLVNKLILDIDKIEKKLATLKEAHEIADNSLNIQKSREEEKDKLNREKDAAERLKQKVSQYEESREKVEALDLTVKNLSTIIQEIKTTIGGNEKRLEDISKELDEINKAKDSKRKMESELRDYTDKGDKLSKLKTAVKRWNGENTKHQREYKKYTELDTAFKSAKNEYENLEDILRRSQAGILAANLEEGKPCPVCGSTEHPQLASMEDSSVTEEAVEQSREAMEAARVLRDVKYNDLTVIYTSMNSIKSDTIDPLIKELLGLEDLEDINSISDEVEELIASNENLVTQCKKGIEGFKTLIDAENEKVDERNNLTEANTKLKPDLELKNQEYIQEKGNLSAAQAALDIIKSEFKGEIISLEDIEAKIMNFTDSLLAMKKEYEAAEKAFDETKSLYNQEQGNYNTTKDLKEKTDGELTETYNTFNAKLLEFGFEHPDDYLESCLAEEKINEIEEEINDFNKKLDGAKLLYENSMKEIEGLLIVDIDSIKEKLEKEVSDKEELQRERMNIHSRIMSNSKVYEACIAYNKMIEGDEKKFETVGKLSNIINGDNSKKINFERYVLAAYFEDIIEAANLRFSKMTSNRFELLRKQEMGDKRKGQGLDLEVFDNYTGKARDIRTLSGGESFKASLSMALGLADVVQAHAGGIQLDTMFIDEGFGTLDPESLDNAVECLMDLQNDGRLVGVISHVAELKERIQAKLEVCATHKGSRAVFRV
jgi:DNA repair protein SbcC/Rad50